MNLQDLITLTTMRDESRLAKKSAKEVCEQMFASASEGAKWRRQWLSSSQFVLMQVPVNVVARANTNIQASAAPANGPIIVDVNKNKIGASITGFTPPVIVVGGEAQHKAASDAGNETIIAWVGNLAAQKLNLFAGYSVAKPNPSPGSGVGPRLNETKNYVTADATKKRIKQMNVHDEVDIEAEFNDAVKKGYKPRMDAVAPPGCEHTVMGLKKKYGNTATVYKIANWMHDQGKCGGHREDGK